MAECLESLVGLTDIDCECFQDLQPDGWNESESGRFLTDPEVGFPTLASVFESVDCGSEFWDLMRKARSQGIRDFRHELSIKLKQYQDPRVPVFRGVLGKTKVVSRTNPNQAYIGCIVRFQRWRDAFAVIDRIGLNLTTSETVQVTIDSNDPDFVPVEIEITTVANQMTYLALDTEIRFDFHSEHTDELFYVVYYTLPSGANINDNKVRCCGYSDPVKNGIMTFGGFASDDLEDLEDITETTHANGLSVGIRLDCDHINFLCNLAQFAASDILEDVAAAIQAKGAAKLISLVLDSGTINRFTLKPQEELFGRRSRLQKNAAEYIEAIASNYRSDLSGCWVCKDNSRFRKVQKQM